MEFESLIAYNSITFIAGDLNAKHRQWNCARANNLGNQLHNFAIHAKMRIMAPDHPTCYTRFSESVIDLAITRNFNYPTTAESLVELGSDHLPVRFHVEMGTNPSLYDKQKFTPNWKKYQEYLLLADSPSSPPRITKKEIESEVQSLTALLFEAHTKTGKWVKEKNDDYSEAIRTKKETRNRLRRVWQRTRHPDDKTNYNRAHNSLKKLYNIRENKKYTNEITSVSPQDGTVWKLIKRFSGEKFRMPPIIIENDIAYTNEEKANEIANSLEKQFKNNDISHPPLKSMLKQKVREFKRSQTHTAITPCNASEVFDNIGKLKNNKSPGIDKISNNMLKRLPLKTIFRLTDLINAILRRRLLSSQY
ncbi:putative RNA-directed DNA polymerase from transposon X-element [Araneus ventricosus]|uniref:Putative RNA-directed DNA polymerase from transposon X-element n=1 Tax=Araneus ventricosus TaxID=182803 RepID=A0A4Y2ANJ0_ARAVE|nr:putative RNA-directed DNA polymerase from transposon X-element [Araneus ventricosus]